MRILVAGGAGFVGSNLCERLVDQGHEVLCIDNLSTGRIRNLANLLTHSRFCFIEHDVIKGVPDTKYPVDRIYHLASPASPPGYQSRQIETLRVNSEGTLHLLELAEKHGARLLYASTSEVYGDPLEHPQSEEYRGNVSSVGPRSMYDEGKRYGEALCMAFYRVRQVDVRIVRIFNTYGPKSDPYDGRIVPSFITQALLNKPITVYGDGRQTRALCYIDDTIEGMIRMMESEKTSGEVVNLGNPDEHSVLDYAKLIIELTGSSSNIHFQGPVVGDDPHRRCPDISKAKRLLDWAPCIPLSEGLPRTIEYFRTELAELGVLAAT